MYRKFASELDVVRSLAFDADGVKLHRKSKVFGVTAGTLFQVLYQAQLRFLDMRVRVVIRNDVVDQLGMKVELGECVSMSAHGCCTKLLTIASVTSAPTQEPIGAGLGGSKLVPPQRDQRADARADGEPQRPLEPLGNGRMVFRVASASHKARAIKPSHIMTAPDQ